MPWHRRLAALAALCLPAIGAAQQPAARPADVVRTFYRFHFAHDMAFTRSAVRRREGWLSSDLLALCRAYFAASSPTDEVPEIDGDPFTDSQEYPASFRVGAARVAGDTAQVPVTFSWKAGDRRVVTVVLVARRDWKIADVRYERGETLRGELTTKQ
ncbi:MAG: DUF3828 domain-containing protein [Gemmatimonadales bacterium]|jgi:hypothetical protein